MGSNAPIHLGFHEWEKHAGTIILIPLRREKNRFQRPRPAWTTGAFASILKR
jgi:hypothetical protein